jgi:nicotinamidase-related amidase
VEIELPVRFTGDQENQPEFTSLQLSANRTALLLVDCNGDCGEDCNRIIRTSIASALQATRSIGIKSIFVYSEERIIGPASRPAEYHELRRGKTLRQQRVCSIQPEWADCIEPRSDEPTIAKRSQNAFVGTYLDSYLRSWNIETLLVAGFSFKSCLFYTMVGAFEREYRVVFLRDGTHPPGTNEFPDTVDPHLAEGGWVRLVMTRLIEDHLGYSSTCEALISACTTVT